MSVGGAFDALESLLRQRHERSFAQLSRIAQSQVREATNPNKLIPNVDLSENRDCIRVMVDLPGVLAQDIDVTIDHGVLCIEGSRKIMDADDAVVVKKQKFTRRYAIDTDVVDCAGATAVLANGVLTFRAPKKERKLQVVRVPVVDGNSVANGNGHPLPQALQPEQQLLGEQQQQGEDAEEPQPPISNEPDLKLPPVDGKSRPPGSLEGQTNAPTKSTLADIGETPPIAQTALAMDGGDDDDHEDENDNDAVVSSEESSSEQESRLPIDPK
jgi:HSP20 family molecular chaperone IbpA